MPWLVVLGKGSWGYGRETFKAGVHEVDETVAAAARKLDSNSVLVSVDKPEITKDVDDGKPLTLDDVKLGRTVGVALRAVEDLEPEVFERDPRDEYQCQHCDEARPTQAALDRHLETHNVG